LAADRGGAQDQFDYSLILYAQEFLVTSKSIGVVYLKLSADQRNAKAQFDYGAIKEWPMVKRNTVESLTTEAQFQLLNHLLLIIADQLPIKGIVLVHTITVNYFILVMGLLSIHHLLLIILMMELLSRIKSITASLYRFVC
jgi:hypothetical protein